jgi:molybdate transport system regulatory protein
MKHNDRAKARREEWLARPRWRITRGAEIAMGPGKADLLEAIASTGSISAAASRLGMSYRRAWILVAEMNRCFARPLVATSPRRREGARLTPEGGQALRLYRRLERLSRAAARPVLARFGRLLQGAASRKSRRPVGSQ